jgi:hypothetical protein
MRRAQGYGLTTMDGKVIEEEDSFTCVHCNTIVFVKPKQDPAEMGGVCRLCSGLSPAYICQHCEGLGTCDPFEKKLLRMEARGKLMKAVGI